MDSKRFLAICLILVSVMGALPAAASESFFDRQGFTLMHGRSVWTDVGPDADVDYEWTSLGYLLDKDLTAWFSVGTQLGAGYLHTRNGGNSPTAEVRILADLHYGWLFLQMGTGVARVFNVDNLPGLAETRLHSILCGAAGLRFPLGGSGPVLSLGYGVDHLSAISKQGRDGDTGWNAGGPRVTVTWPF